MIRVTASTAQIKTWLYSGGQLGPGQFTYSLPTGTSVWPGYAAGSEPFTSYAIPTAALATAFRAAMAIWDGLISPNFTEVADNANGRGEVRVAFSDLADGTAGLSYGSATATSGSKLADIWVDTGYTSSSFQPGDYSFEVLLHEIGHSLGLKHSFEAPAAPAALDNRRYTIMSYTDPTETLITLTGTANGYTGTFGSVVEKTPMVLDIAAIQALYGADPTTRAGATTYTFTQGDASLQTIYDAGGIDTIDLSNFTRANYVDLTPGAYSSIGQWSAAEQVAYYSSLWPGLSQSIAADFAGQSVYTWTDNLGIALSTVIENATGGAGNDTLIGNAVANTLIGNAGNDSFNGGLGNDTIDGGAGIDTAIFSGAHTGYRLVYQGAGAAQVSGADGVDQLAAVEKVQFADGTYMVPTSLFDTSAQVATSFGASAEAGGWSSQERYGRTMADVNGDGRADVIGFGEAGTYVALAKADGSYGAATLATSDFGRGASAGGWDGATALPRALADVNGDGKMDIVGFGNAGTYVALGRGDGSFGSLTFATVDFGRNPGAGGWTSQDATPRLLGDVNGDGRADVVGFGNAGTYVALARADGTFGPLTFATRDFGHDAGAGGWASQDQFPRLLADVNGDGRADVIGFGNAGTYVAFGKADGTFGPLTLATGDFGASAAAGGWSSAGLYPRAAADVNGDGAADLVGFGNAGAYVALGDGTGHFGSLTLATSAFGSGAGAGGWSAQDLYPRLLADTDGDGRADLVGFGNAGIYTATAAAFDPVVTSSGETREADVAMLADDAPDHAPVIADMPAFHADAFGGYAFGVA